MKRAEATHRFDVPVERGFAFITDTANWSRFWPGFVRLEEGSSWGAAGDTARLVTRLLGRERLLMMRITAFEPNRLVTLLDRFLLARGVRRAFQRTFAALEQQFGSSKNEPAAPRPAG